MKNQQNTEQEAKWVPSALVKAWEVKNLSNGQTIEPLNLEKSGLERKRERLMRLMSVLGVLCLLSGMAPMGYKLFVGKQPNTVILVCLSIMTVTILAAIVRVYVKTQPVLSDRINEINRLIIAFNAFVARAHHIFHDTNGLSKAEVLASLRISATRLAGAEGRTALARLNHCVGTNHLFLVCREEMKYRDEFEEKFTFVCEYPDYYGVIERKSLFRD